MADENRVWFITGASSGFGQALAEAVLARGERAVLAARRAERLASLAEHHDGRALALALDVTDTDARSKAVEQAMARFGRIDVLANIAGRGSLGAVEEFAPEQLREQIELNFIAAAELTRAVLPHMRARGSGHILNLTSIGGLVSIGGFGAYCAAKFALEAWSEALHDEVAPLGIRVTIVEPGSFRTEFAGDINMRPLQQIEDYRPIIQPVEAFLDGQAGRQAGDPDKAAARMIEVVESEAPPLRLMLGSDAYELWDRTVAARNAELAAWRERGEATSFADAQMTRIGSADGHG
ncbi:oxidoreductase [Sphingomonas sp. DT-207]|uniref:oxidoreductase n=1 Tax=Sphingomonas sp. DT-207 TaxID=3396167 RepID=UPI003F1AAAC0